MSSRYQRELGCQNHCYSEVPWCHGHPREVTSAGSSQALDVELCACTQLQPSLTWSPVSLAPDSVLGGSIWLSKPWRHVHTLGGRREETMAFLLLSISDRVGSPPTSAHPSRRTRPWETQRLGTYTRVLTFRSLPEEEDGSTEAEWRQRNQMPWHS